jgi:hypothetical protein
MLTGIPSPLHMYTYEWMIGSYIRVCVIELCTHPPTLTRPPPTAARRPHSQQASQSRSNASIIAMLNPNLLGVHTLAAMGLLWALEKGYYAAHV